jgi:hypothetical protein
LTIVVDTSVMFKSVYSVSFLTYHGALVISRTRFWILCILSVCGSDIYGYQCCECPNVQMQQNKEEKKNVSDRSFHVFQFYSVYFIWLRVIKFNKLLI